jgi:hypothetical protein
MSLLLALEDPFDCGGPPVVVESVASCAVLRGLSDSDLEMSADAASTCIRHVLRRLRCNWAAEASLGV